MGNYRSRLVLVWPLLLAVTGLLLIKSYGNEDAEGGLRRRPVPWHLDPQSPPPAAEDQDLHVVVKAGCGERSGDYLKDPTVDYGDAGIVLKFEIHKPRGPEAGCLTLTHRTVRLRQPIGATKIIDGTTHQERHPTDAQPLRW